MKKETYANKLAKMLGLETLAPEPSTKKTVGAKPNYTGIEFSQIEHYREATALSLFLQAPALFSPATCKHCNEPFLVSRHFVAFCSYGCLKADLYELGIEWHPEARIDEAYVRRVWDDNEPLRVSPHAFKLLQEMIQDQDGHDLEPYEVPQQYP